jgi:hypothetical protein
MTVPADPDPYFTEIEAVFNRRRGAPLLLSPRDWGLIEEWKRAGVPLRIALQGIENCFDAYERRSPATRRINSLSYCRQEVLGLHELYLGLRAVEAGRPAEGGGGHPAPPPAAPTRALGRHLGRLQRRLKESMAWCSAAHLDPLVGVLAEAAAEIRALRRLFKQAPPDPGAVEGALNRLDAGLIAAARAALPPDEVRACEAEVDGALAGSRDRMTPEALEATRRAAIDRLLRRRGGLPRLSLFD